VSSDRATLKAIYRGCCWIPGREVVIMTLLIAFSQFLLFQPNLTK
jgi:hypothetical protein